MAKSVPTRGGVDVVADDVEIIADDETAAPESVVTVAEGEVAQLPAQAVMQSDGTVRLALKYPVTLRYKSGATDAVREEQYDSFTFRRLNGADMRAIMTAAAESRPVVSIARSAGVREALMQRLFDRMDAADVVAAGAVVSYFLESGRTATGR